MNNPLRYTDPSGHTTARDAWDSWYKQELINIDEEHSRLSSIISFLKDLYLTYSDLTLEQIQAMAKDYIYAQDIPGWQKDWLYGVTQQIIDGGDGAGRFAVFMAWNVAMLTAQKLYDTRRQFAYQRYRDGLFLNRFTDNSTSPPGWSCYRNNCERIPYVAPNQI
jgi:hypothetical protein